MPDLSPADLLPRLVAADSARPRVTCYDDLPGPTAGERIELSARVLTTWASKAGNALQEEWDIAPGSRVVLRAAPHWRCLYWALATWQVGASLVLDGAADEGDADLVVTDELPDGASSLTTVFLTRASLARSAGTSLPDGVVDEAAEISGYGDHFDAWEVADPDDLALVTGALEASHASLVGLASERWPDLPHACRLDVAPTSTLDLLLAAVAAWAVDGSLVVHLGGTDPAVRSRRGDDEGVDRSQ